MDIQSIKNRFGIIGNSPALNYALQVATQVANTDLTVLIVGESGVGKEIFSQIIHALSPRKHNPFIAVNCGAIPEGTIDSELFGHEKGSFTGAVDSRKGYFETVNGGTLFMDEIGETPLGTQARLLRVLENSEFIRVGSSKVQKTDVRVIAATNKDLLTATQNNKFREDLYYRLNTVPIRVPSLRERKEDIILLFRKFAVDFAERYRTSPIQLTEEAKTMMLNYPWPGNVRELKNIAEQISVLAEDKSISGNDLERFLPKNNVNNLPMLVGSGNISSGQNEFMNERDILYKLFFDLKKDVTEMKKMFLEIVQNPSNIPTVSHVMEESYRQDLPSSRQQQDQHTHGSIIPVSNQPMFITENREMQDTILVDESLNIMDKEKELIEKALRKHKGKRKDAASDLGISERTLYRKLKEYDIED
ncbi:MAG: sigma-54 dependent transcriptional regulator [Chitinophagaceae bacterium]|jgi:DNA-binding NtrC family response regulator|nr:sigma-54 dependent transcriptional regulator [Chitinophagaceae bacterium]